MVVNTVYSAGGWKPGIHVIFLSHHDGRSCLCLLGIDCLWERGRKGGKNEQGSDRGRGVRRRTRERRGSEEAMEVRMKRGKMGEGRTVSVINIDGYVGEMLWYVSSCSSRFWHTAVSD